MSKNLPKAEKLVSISEAAEFLSVSLDTIRRWDKNGTLHSQRPNGKDRYFSIDELENKKLSTALSITEAAHRLGISPSTLRRLEQKKLIKPNRATSGERIYTREILEAF